LRGRSRWTSTFVASLELTKQGDVVLQQDGTFAPISVQPGQADRMQAMAPAGGDA